MNDKIRTFEDLIVWQRAIAFVKQVYIVTDEGGLTVTYEALRETAIIISKSLFNQMNSIKRATPRSP